MHTRGLPEKIRASLGSAVVLGLTKAALDAEPTTIYLLTFLSSKCSANCGFCPQARKSRGRADMLSRVTWPVFPTERVVSRIQHAVKKGAVERVCIQALNYPTVFEDVENIVREVLSRVNVPISISCQPMNREEIRKLAEVGVERICVPLDATTEELFNKVKGRLAGGPYVWEEQRRSLKEAVHIFGKGSVSTHLIVGLGETEEEAVRAIQWCVDLGVYPGLFAFTPIRGTTLETRARPSISHYRTIQIAHSLITDRRTRCEEMYFSKEGAIKDFGIPIKHLEQTVRTGKPFLTSGCPGCNRPYYNERPGGPIYNYPRHPQSEEIAEIKEQISALDA
ncbi:MAG: radical SAM protein [Candidatus Bathyarchaeota archaeon]|nr:MAG: radical SAM protein [Candidatus Bathyarchaeota archaeon]